MIKLSCHMESKNYRVVCKDRRVFEGRCMAYTPAIDNEPEIDSISIEHAPGFGDEIFITEMESIERID